jgi:hypothetical protein
MFGRQVFSYLSHTASPLCLSYFSGRGLMVLPGAGLDYSPPTYAFHVTRMIGINHHAWLTV